MQNLKFRISGIQPLLMNNPQCVDPFNKYSKAKKLITNKRPKLEEDLLELQRLDVKSKIYFNDKGVYVPSTWIRASIESLSFKLVKIAKKDIRASVFPVEQQIQLQYKDMNLVKTSDDISSNKKFYHTMLLKMGQQVKLAKSTPIFHDWSFESSIDFDQSIVDREHLITILNHACKFGGYGDFRPTFGRAELEILN